MGQGPRGGKELMHADALMSCQPAFKQCNISYHITDRCDTSEQSQSFCCDKRIDLCMILTPAFLYQAVLRGVP
jgi:hypothetical protein